VLGEGASGLGGASARLGGDGGSGGTDATDGSTGGSRGTGGLYGGGRGGGDAATQAGGGGGLRYINNMSVTPGETLTVVIPSPSVGGGGAACRIIWPGNLRQFPSTRTTDE
jgi:hypothetical protein